MLKQQALPVLIWCLQFLPPSLLFDVSLLDSLTPILLMLLFSKSFSNWLGQRVKLLLYILLVIASSGSQMEARLLWCCGPDLAKSAAEHLSPGRPAHTCTT